MRGFSLDGAVSNYSRIQLLFGVLNPLQTLGTIWACVGPEKAKKGNTNPSKYNRASHRRCSGPNKVWCVSKDRQSNPEVSFTVILSESHVNHDSVISVLWAPSPVIEMNMFPLIDQLYFIVNCFACNNTKYIILIMQTMCNCFMYCKYWQLSPTAPENFLRLHSLCDLLSFL